MPTVLRADMERLPDDACRPAPWGGGGTVGGGGKAALRELLVRNYSVQ